jgi:hypothetical protein
MLSQVTSCNPLALIVLWNCQFQWSTSTVPVHFRADSLCLSDFMCPFCSYLAKWMLFPITQWWSPPIRSSYLDARYHSSTLELEEDDHLYFCVFSTKWVVILKLISFTEQVIQDMFPSYFPIILVTYPTVKALIESVPYFLKASLLP